MPSKDKKTISTKISPEEFEWLESFAASKSISVSSVMNLCVSGIIRGDINIEEGEIKTGVYPNGYEVCEESDTPFGIEVDKKLSKLLERGYPESFLYSIKEQILSGIDDQLSMLPKRFDARRSGNDWGC